MIYKTFDIETTGLRAYQGDRIFSFCIGDDKGDVEVYRGFNQHRKLLQDFFLDINIAKICHNYKFELSFLLMHDITIPDKTIWHDTMIMSQMLRNLSPAHGLDYLCWELCEYPRDLDKKVKAQASARGQRYDKVDVALMNAYQIADGQRPMILFNTFYPALRDNKAMYTDYRNEIELVKVTQRMEQQGLKIDRGECQRLQKWLMDELIKVRDRVYVLYNEYINLNSSQKIINLLYRRLELPILEYTDNKKPSTDKTVLLKLLEECPEHKETINLVLKQRSYQKGYSMIESYMNLADDNDRLHSNINTNIAATGRESITKPPLQTVSKKAVLKIPFPVPARKCFRADDGHVLLFADYQGLQLRLIIGICQEEEMLKILADDGDVHEIGTEMFYEIKKVTTAADDWEEHRNAAKNADFALPFGAGISQMAATLNLPMVIAKDRIERYCQRFPKLASFSSTQTQQVRRFGHVTTPFGRILYVNQDKPFMGANYLIQGTEAGILKRVQVRIGRYLKGKDVKLVIPVHDELIFSYPINKWKHKKEFIKEVSDIMTAMPEINVTLKVEWSMSKGTWYDATEIKI